MADDASELPSPAEAGDDESDALRVGFLRQRRSLNALSLAIACWFYLHACVDFHEGLSLWGAKFNLGRWDRVPILLALVWFWFLWRYTQYVHDFGLSAMRAEVGRHDDWIFGTRLARKPHLLPEGGKRIPTGARIIEVEFAPLDPVVPEWRYSASRSFGQTPSGERLYGNVLVHYAMPPPNPNTSTQVSKQEYSMELDATSARFLRLRAWIAMTVRTRHATDLLAPYLFAALALTFVAARAFGWAL